MIAPSLDCQCGVVVGMLGFPAVQPSVYLNEPLVDLEASAPCS